MNKPCDLPSPCPSPLSIGHANTRAFLSHGGLNSIYEAMYHGVPVVGVPLFGDHYDTMTRVAAKGMGIMLHWKSMSQEELHAALTAVITDSRYRQRALLLSNIHKDQPGHPVTRAVYWISYLLRHQGASHLRSAAHSVPTYQYFLLDVVLVLGAGSALIGFALYQVGRWLRSKFVGKKANGKMTGGDHLRMANGHCHSNGVVNGKHKVNGSLRSEKKFK